MVTIEITEEEATAIARKLPNRESWGGWQRVFHRLHQGMTKDAKGQYRITVDNTTAQRAIDGADPKYGRGTYQTPLRVLAPRLSAALGAPPKQCDLELEA